MTVIEFPSSFWLALLEKSFFRMIVIVLTDVNTLMVVVFVLFAGQHGRSRLVSMSPKCRAVSTTESLYRSPSDYCAPV